MHAFSHVLALTALTALMPSEGSPCVPDPGSIDLEFPKPALQQPGIPVGAVWPPGPPPPPTAHEEDPLKDDGMGTATPNEDGSSAGVTITNIGGNLFGPNGEDQNGVGEGECIEVKVCWTYHYPKTVTYGFKFGLADVLTGSARFGVTMVLWAEATICSDSVEVCPCPGEE